MDTGRVPERCSFQNLLSIWVLLLLGIGLYAGTLFYGPVWDDHRFVFGDSFLMDCGNIWSVLAPKHLHWVLPVRNAARPAWLASVLLDSCLYQGATPGYRMTSILLHAAGGVMLLLLAWRVSRSRLIAVFAAVLFLAHPLHTESVNLITFRTDLLAFLFMAPALLLYLEGREAAGGRRLAWYAGSACLYLLAMLAKEMAVVLPALMILADVLFPPAGERTRRASGAIRVYVAFAVVFAGYMWFRTPRSGYQMKGHRDFFTSVRERVDWLRAPVSPDVPAEPRAGNGGMERLPWHRLYGETVTRAATMSRIMGSYLRRLFWPHPLQGDYSPDPVDTWRDKGVLASWAAWIALLALAWSLRRRRPVLSFALFWLPVTLAPVSGVFAILNPEAERYLYIPSAGACLFLAALFAEAGRLPWRQSGACAAAFAAAFAAVYGTMTLSRNRDYRDEGTYYASTLRVDGTVGRSHYNLAGVCLLSGDRARAEAGYRRAVEYWPTSLRARNSLAVFLAKRGDLDESVSHLERAVQLGPEQAWLRFNLGTAYRKVGRPEKALEQFQTALRLDPRSGDAAVAAAGVLLSLGRKEEAILLLREAAESAGWKSHAVLRELILAYRGAGHPGNAREVLRTLERFDPELARRLRDGAAGKRPPVE